MEILILNLLQTRPSLKTRLSQYLGLTMTKETNFKFFSKQEGNDP